MTRPKPLLDELARRGKPLAEVIVTPEDHTNPQDLHELLDVLAPDISASILPAYLQNAGGPIRYELRVEATQEALLREFGWRLERVKFYDSAEDGGEYPDAYMWETPGPPAYFPEPLQGKIKCMGLTQPGASDNGRADTVSYEVDG